MSEPAVPPPPVPLSTVPDVRNPTKGWRLPWVSRRAWEMLQFAYARLEADLFYERNRWMSLVNAERVRAERWENIALANRAPSGRTIGFPEGVKMPRPAGGATTMSRFEAMAQSKADEEARLAGDLARGLDPVPGMTDPDPPLASGRAPDDLEEAG